MVGALKIYGSASLLSSPYYANVQLPERHWTVPEFVCCCPFSPVGAPQWVGLAGSPQRRSQLRAELSWWPLSAAALAAWGPSRSPALIEQGTLQNAVPVRDSGTERASAVARQPCWCCRGEWLCSTSSRSICSRRTMPCHLVRGSWSPMAPRFVMERDLDNGPSRSWFPGRPLLRFPRRTPTGSSRDSRSGIPAETNQPHLTPNLAWPTPGPGPVSVREASRHLAL